MTAVQAIRLLDALKQRLLDCSVDELRVLDVLLKRLELGRDRYGFLDLSKPRNWKLEKSEEHVDAAIYDACDVIAKDDERRQREQCEAADEFAATSRVEFGLNEFIAKAGDQ